MKNIIFYSISLSLVGLMCCYDEASENIISLNILALDEIENMSNFGIIDDFNLEILPLSNYFKMMCIGSWNKVIDIFNKMFDNLLVDNTINELDTNTAKRISRNANTVNGPLAQSNISEVQQNLSMSTESVFQNKVIKNQTQPYIDYSFVTNSTPSADFLSAALINNNTNRSNNSYENKISNKLNNLSTWSESTTIKKHMNFISIIISSALLLLFLGIMQFVAYRTHRFRNLRREIDQQREILL